MLKLRILTNTEDKTFCQKTTELASACITTLLCCCASVCWALFSPACGA